MYPIACIVGLLAGVFASSDTDAATLRLDDSASPRNQVQAQTVTDEQGRPLAQSRHLTQVTIRFGSIDYRLNTAGFIGKRARIYYVVPVAVTGLLSPQALRVEWRGHGRFAGGAAHPGERTLVWSGAIATPWIDESFDLSMQLDLRQYRPRSATAFALESYFEIETLP